MVRTVTIPESRPLLRSRTSKRVSVQSSPRSQRNSEPRQRRRATAVDCCARSSKRRRAEEGGGVSEGSGQTQEQQADQETYPETFSALREAHHCTSRAPVAAALSRLVF